MDITSLNLVNQQTQVTPNYDLSGSETSIILYFNNEDDLVILGQADNNYIFWASRSKTYEKDKNEAIFNYTANEPFGVVSQRYMVGINYGDLKRYYRADLKRSKENGMAWKTPFGHYYGLKQVNDNGRYFAQDVESFVRKLHRRCNYREANGAYEAMLDFWLGEISRIEDDALRYPSIELLVEMIKEESYLILSLNEPIREKYLLLLKKSDDMYNRYMSIVR